MKTKIKDNIIYLDEGRLEIFTPQKYMGRYNVIMGSSMKAFGLVIYKFYCLLVSLTLCSYHLSL